MIFGTVLFMVVLVVIAYLWESAISEIKDAEVIYDLGWHATMVSETFVRTAGSPNTWEDTIFPVLGGYDYSNVSMIGFADTVQLIESKNIQDRLVDPDKVLWFNKIVYEDYDEARDMILRTGRYDFYVKIICRDGGVECFENLYVPKIPSGKILCNNGFNITVTDNYTGSIEDPGAGYCIVGRYTTISNASYITSATKNAVFNEPINVTDIPLLTQRSFNKAIELKVVTYQSGV